MPTQPSACSHTISNDGNNQGNEPSNEQPNQGKPSDPLGPGEGGGGELSGGGGGGGPPSGPSGGPSGNPFGDPDCSPTGNNNDEDSWEHKTYTLFTNFKSSIDTLGTILRGMKPDSSDSGKTKVRDPDVFDSSDPQKLRSFLVLLSLVFLD